MSTELNLGADWKQSKRLVFHWHCMHAKSEAFNKLLQSYIDEAVALLQRSGPNPLFVDPSNPDEYYERLRNLYAHLGIEQEDNDGNE